MKILIIACCFLVSIVSLSQSVKADSDDFNIAQLNIYGGANNLQPNGINISDEGTLNAFAPNMSHRYGRITNKIRKGLLASVISAYPGALVDTTPNAPTCNDQPTMDYNIMKFKGGDTITLIHYFHCHTFIALGGLDPANTTIVSNVAAEVKAILDGESALSQVNN